ncbi:helix-turn-helix transcriptional regulator [Streptomyces sp. WAC 06738]|uniref:ATP-binding protein n=1 Tax=Streptomyces sp. WAC 06738 TaxID=2203210 RepID=UPI000F6E401B|nr:LuxR family transcriptional regulator [Streptomyces sp. WAC 06738]AZM47392.1 helix-turn-helix transcriptional regulator [Streptomyces sp. WAC 06738]
MTVTVPRPAEAPVLVGRARELGALVDAVTRAPSVAMVEGEAGIGKTRLIREALRDPAVRGRRVLLGGCRPLREPFPYGPVFDLLRHLAGGLPTALSPVCGALRAYLPELADRLPPAPELLSDLRARRHRLFRAVRALLDAAGETVMVVEDLHWTDDGTRDLLRFLVDDPPDGLSAVLSYRREDLPGSGLPLGRAYRQPPGTTAVVIPLRPLDVHGVRGMFTALTGAAESSDAFTAELHRRTAGIPFVVEEVVRALPAAEHGAPHGGPEHGAPHAAFARMPVPTRLQEAVADRMSVLSPAAADAVRAASVLRVPAGEALIAAVVRGTPGQPAAPADSAAVREALRAGVLHEWGEDRYGFRHALAQQAVYAGLLGPDRRRLHRQAMRALAAEDPQPLIQLAYHAHHGGEPARWQRYAEAAAASAREMGDLALAVGVLEELLSDGRLGRPERARIAVDLSRDAVVGLTHHRATALLHDIVRDRHIPEGVRGEIRLNLGLLLYNQAGRYEEGRVSTEVAVAELHARPALAARGMAALAMPSWGDHPRQVYEAWIARAEALVAHESDPAVRTAVRGNHLALRMSLGDPAVRAEADGLVAGPGPGTHRRQVARACGNFADAATCLGHYQAAQRYRGEGRRLAAECGAAFLEGIVEGTALRLEWYAGRWRGLAERCRHTLDTVQGVSSIAADAHLVLGLLASALGEWDEAAAELAAAGLADPRNAPAPVLATAAGAMTRLLAARGDPERARAEAERGLARIRRKDIWPWAGDLAPPAVTALVRAGELRAAEEVTAELAAGIAGRDAPLAAAALRACRGIVAAGRRRPEEAAGLFTAAQRAYAALPQPYSAARAGEAAARCRLPAATGPEPARELAAFAQQFTDLGAIRDAARCRRVLRGHNVPLPSRRGRRGYGDQLSPREREVARLVALGHTNREIADVLFLSPRTVEQHVAKLLRKLHVGSRSEVAEAAGRAEAPGGAGNEYVPPTYPFPDCSAAADMRSL